jgi:hypothetical protein
VEVAIETAIVAAEARADRQVKFDMQLSMLGRGDSAKWDAQRHFETQGVDFAAQAAIAADRYEQVASKLARSDSGRPRPSRQTLTQPIYTTVRPPGDALPSFPMCLYPADRFSSSSPKAAWASGNAAKAEMGLFLFSHEVGGIAGVLASAVPPPITGSLWYGINPPIGGTLAVIAQVLVSGYLHVSAESWSPIINYNPFLRADALARLVVRTHQSGGTGTQSETLVIGEAHACGGEIRGRVWVDDLFVVVLYAQVLPNLPVAIEIGVELEGQGRSTFGRAAIGLMGTDGEPGIKVAAACLNLTPTVIL